MQPETTVYKGRFGEQLQVNGKRCGCFPCERPLESIKCHLWDVDFNYIGLGCSFYDRGTGIAFLCDGKKIDSNSVVLWSPLVAQA